MKRTFLLFILLFVFPDSVFAATESIKTIKSSGGDYTSLAAWEAAEQSDLVTSDLQKTAECYAMNDTTAVVVAGWTPDATRYIKIYTPTAERHAGVWDGAKYNLRTTVAATSLSVQENDVYVDGLQVNNTQYNGTGIACIGPSSGSFHLSNSIIKMSTSLPGTSIACNVNSMTVYLWNNIAYEHRNDAVTLYGTSTYHVYNNTIKGKDIVPLIGLRMGSAGGTYNLKNNVIFSNYNDISLFGTYTIDYNASDDGDGTNAVTPADWGTVFIDHANGDFRLEITDTDLISAGTNDPGSGLYDDDIAGNLRTSPWDIGAHESIKTYWPAKGSIFYSDGIGAIIFGGQVIK